MTLEALEMEELGFLPLAGDGGDGSDGDGGQDTPSDVGGTDPTDEGDDVGVSDQDVSDAIGAINDDPGGDEYSYGQTTTDTGPVIGDTSGSTSTTGRTTDNTDDARSGRGFGKTGDDYDEDIDFDDHDASGGYYTGGQTGSGGRTPTNQFTDYNTVGRTIGSISDFIKNKLKENPLAFAPLPFSQIIPLGNALFGRRSHTNPWGGAAGQEIMGLTPAPPLSPAYDGHRESYEAYREAYEEYADQHAEATGLGRGNYGFVARGSKAEQYLLENGYTKNDLINNGWYREPGDREPGTLGPTGDQFPGNTPPSDPSDPEPSSPDGTLPEPVPPPPPGPPPAPPGGGPGGGPGWDWAPSGSGVGGSTGGGVGTGGGGARFESARVPAAAGARSVPTFQSARVPQHQPFVSARVPARPSSAGSSFPGVGISSSDRTEIDDALYDLAGENTAPGSFGQRINAAAQEITSAFAAQHTPLGSVGTGAYQGPGAAGGGTYADYRPSAPSGGNVIIVGGSGGAPQQQQQQSSGSGSQPTHWPTGSRSSTGQDLSGLPTGGSFGSVAYRDVSQYFDVDQFVKDNPDINPALLGDSYNIGNKQREKWDRSAAATILKQKPPTELERRMYEQHGKKPPGFNAYTDGQIDAFMKITADDKYDKGYTDKRKEYEDAYNARGVHINDRTTADEYEATPGYNVYNR